MISVRVNRRYMAAVVRMGKYCPAACKYVCMCMYVYRETYSYDFCASEQEAAYSCGGENRKVLP
jgi:hypothetical protein